MNSFKKYFEYNKSSKGYGNEFDISDLDIKLRKYFRTDTLVKIEVEGKQICGKIDVSTGWKPSFVLVKSKPTKDSRIVWLNSSHTKYKIIGIKSPGQSRYKNI